VANACSIFMETDIISLSKEKIPIMIRLLVSMVQQWYINGTSMVHQWDIMLVKQCYKPSPISTSRVAYCKLFPVIGGL
jgi:hypothetical protein